MEKVATVIPTYNRRNWLEGALVAAIKKQWGNLVVIVVDGGSTDDTAGFLKMAENDFSTTNIEFAHTVNQEDFGIAGTLNTGIKLAMKEYDAEYIEWMSDDDRHLPHKVNVQISYFRNEAMPKLGMVYSGYNAHWIDGPPEKGFRINRTVPAIPTYYPDRKAQWEALKKLCIINGSAALIKTEVFEDVGYFDPQWDYAQDYEMWLRIQRSWNTFRVPQILCDRFNHGEMLTEKVVAEGLGEEPRLFEYIKDWELEEI